MLNSLVQRLRMVWHKLSEVPAGFFRNGLWSEYGPFTIKGVRPFCGPDQPLTLSPFWAALRLYQNSLGVMPLVTYRRDADGGRHRLDDPIVYGLLHDRPNPSMSRVDFFDFLIKEYFLRGEFFVQIQWANNHRLLGLYPIASVDVTQVEIDEGWNKIYHVNGFTEPLRDDEVLHVKHFSACGLRGTPFIRYAAESLGLHKQVLDSATAYYANAAKPSGYLSYPGKITKDALPVIKAGFKDEYQGTANTGNIPVLDQGASFNQFPNTAAADAQIIEAIGASVDDIARWFDNLSPLVLGNLSRGTYSNSAADKLAFYQKNLLPLVEKIQLEINYKLFGLNSDIYCEFLTDAVLRADPKEQAEVWHMAIQDGYVLRSECREWLNLDPVPGLDQPLAPINMAGPTETTTETTPVTTLESPETTPDPVTEEQAPAAASNDLRATVGGSAQVAAMQTAYYGGSMPRQAAVANLVLLFGFSQAEAEQLLPIIPPTPLTQEPANGTDTQPTI